MTRIGGVRVVEGVALDLAGLTVTDGLINTHDHLSFALFPRLGRGPYANATDWARDVYMPDKSPVSEHLRLPKHLRLLWGGLRNLLSGVTTVSHHDAFDESFDRDFPVRVVREYGWAHSLEFSRDIVERFAATPLNAPFLIHAAEGTDRSAAGELARLDAIGVLTPRTVLIHSVAIDTDGWRLLRERGCSVIWCPTSNLFTLGRTLHISDIPPEINIALGTDSSLTAHGDLLDEMCAARLILRRQPGRGEQQVDAMVGINARRALGQPDRPDDWIAVPQHQHPPELVVVAGRIHLISPRLAEALPASLRSRFWPLQIAGRPPVLVRWNIPQLLKESAKYLDSPIRLAGREVAA